MTVSQTMLDEGLDVGHEGAVARRDHRIHGRARDRRGRRVVGAAYRELGEAVHELVLRQLVIATRDLGRGQTETPQSVEHVCFEVESIPADVRAALAELYPADRATGYSVGDLRGWLWVEVPAAHSGGS